MQVTASSSNSSTSGSPRRHLSRLTTPGLLLGLALLSVALAAAAAVAIYASGTEGLLLALVAALGAGIVIVVAAGLDGWLPLAFALSLLAALNITIAEWQLTFYGFDPLLAGVYLGWLWRAYRGTARPLRWRALDTVGAMLLVWFLVAALLGRHAPTSINGWLLYVRGFLIYFYFAHALDKRWQVRAMLAVLLVMLAIEGGLGLLQYLTRSNFGSISDMVGGTVGTVREVETTAAGELFRVRGTLNTDTSLSHWLEMLVPLALSLGLATRKVVWRVLLGGVVLAGTATQVVTFTRGGWFGLAAGVIVLLVLYVRSQGLSARRLGMALVAVLLLVLLLLPFAGLIGTRLSASEQDTLAVRGNLNRVALSLIADYPLTGIGPDNFVRVAPEYGTGWSWMAAGEVHKVHNVYLALASEAGPLGLLLFLSFVGLVLLTTYRRERQPRSPGDWLSPPVARGILAGQIALLVHGLAAWGLLSYGVFPLFWVLMGLVTCDTGEPRPGQGATLALANRRADTGTKT
jgi:O-antigen ligase